MTSNVKPTLKYLAVTLAHKWYVLQAGLKTKAPLWRLLIHDWTKFLPSEAPHYGRKHYGKNDDPMGYALARNHHFKKHGHHWEFWVPVTVHGSSPVAAGDPLPMPEWAVREMVADWLGARRAYEGSYPESLDDWEGYRKVMSDIRLHPASREILDRVLGELFSGQLEN